MYYNRQKDFFWGALIGGSIATLTTMLFTTKKGRQFQNKVADVYEDVEDAIKEKLADAKDMAREKLSETKEQIEEHVDHAGKKMAHKLKKDHE